MEKTGATILITEPADYNREALDIYASYGTVITLPESQLSFQEAMATVHTLVIRLKHVWDARLLENAKHVKFIVSPTTGLDHIDEAYCKQRNICIISLQGASDFLSSIPSTAELTMGLMLSLVRHIPQAYNHVAVKGWNRDLFKGNNLAGKQLGLIGFGRVGKQVANMAKAFSMKVMAYDPFAANWTADVSKAENVRSLLEECDIISIHIPAKDNDKFVSREILGYAKQGSFLINTSRGSIWDEHAIAELLKQHKLGGVATDVIDGETEPDKRDQSPLIAMLPTQSNLIITPHIAGATFESMQATELFAAKKWLSQVYV